MILAVVVAWAICAVITAARGFPSDPSVPQYAARTDARADVLKEAKWFRLPYPGYLQNWAIISLHRSVFSNSRYMLLTFQVSGECPL